MSPTPPGWDVRPLVDLVEILDSRRVPVSAQERAARRGDVPYYGAAGQVGWIDVALFNEPLVLLGEDGVQFFDPGKRKAYRIDGPAWVNNHAHVLRAGPLVDQRYLEHYLNAFDYRGYANGTTRLKLTQAAMRRIPVLLAPLPEQQRIVQILEDHLSRIDAANDYLAAAARRSAALIASSAAEHVRESSKQWPMSTVGEHAELVEYGSSTKTSAIAESGSVPVLRMGNIKEGRIDWSSLKYLPADHGEFPRLLLRPGDLLFNRTNSTEHVGKCAVFAEDFPASFASYLIRVRFDEDVVPEWAALAINSPQGRNYVASVVSQQVGQANVNGTKLRSFPIPIPSLPEQRRRVAAHRAIVTQGLNLAAELGRVRQRGARLRRALLAAAFSGRLAGRSSDLDIVEEAFA